MSDLINMRYKRCHLGSNRSLIEGTLHGVLSIFSIGGIFLKLQASHCSHICKSRHKFGYHRSINEGTLLAE
jgi:hypothetical protein